MSVFSQDIDALRSSSSRCKLTLASSMIMASPHKSMLPSTSVNMGKHSSSVAAFTTGIVLSGMLKVEYIMILSFSVWGMGRMDPGFPRLIQADWPGIPRKVNAALKLPVKRKKENKITLSLIFGTEFFLCKIKLTCGICGNGTVVAQFSSNRKHLFLQWGQILPVQQWTETYGKCDFSKHLAKMLTRLN